MHVSYNNKIIYFTKSGESDITKVFCIELWVFSCVVKILQKI